MLMPKFKVYCPLFSSGFVVITASSKHDADIWACSTCLGEDYRIVGLAPGGSRLGAGRPKGSGKWAGQKTRPVRIPSKAAENIEDVLDAYSSVTALIKFFQDKAEKAKATSKTADYPRTWDKALELIAELQELLGDELLF